MAIQINAAHRIRVMAADAAVPPDDSAVLSWLKTALKVSGKTKTNAKEKRTSFETKEGDDTIHIDVIAHVADQDITIAGVSKKYDDSWTASGKTSEQAIKAFKRKIKTTLTELEQNGWGGLETTTVIRKLLKGG